MSVVLGDTLMRVACAHMFYTHHVYPRVYADANLHVQAEVHGDLWPDIVIACILIACTVMACILMAYIVMVRILYGVRSHGLYGHGPYTLCRM